MLRDINRFLESKGQSAIDEQEFAEYVAERNPAPWVHRLNNGSWISVQSRIINKINNYEQSED